MFPYFQEFTDAGYRRARSCARASSPWARWRTTPPAWCYRHEQTLSGPKKDRLDLLRATHAHCGQIFMLYADPAGAIDALLDEAAAPAPLAEVTDEYGARAPPVEDRRRGAGPAADGATRSCSSPTAITATRRRWHSATKTPGLPGADRVMMTFVNMHSPGPRSWPRIGW